MTFLLTAGGQASISVAPSPIITMLENPYLSLISCKALGFPPDSDVGSFKSKPA